jgi:hypothetical protein
VKKWVEDHHVDRIERFSQAIGEGAFSEIELAIPGATIDEQIDTLSSAFVQFTGAPLESALMAGLRTIQSPQFAISLRMRGGKITRVAALIPGIAIDDIQRMCADAKVAVDARLGKLVGALGEGIARVEYGRSGDHAGVDVYLEPTDAATPAPAATGTQSN